MTLFLGVVSSCSGVEFNSSESLLLFVLLLVVVIADGCAVSKDVSISSGGEFCNSLRGEIDSVDGLFAPLFILDFLVDRLLIYR